MTKIYDEEGEEGDDEEGEEGPYVHTCCLGCWLEALPTRD